MTEDYTLSVGRSDPVGGWKDSGASGGKVALGVVAVLVIALGAYQLGKRASTPPPRAAATPLPRATAVAATPVPQQADAGIAEFEHARPSPREERSEMVVTIARPESAPATKVPETAHDKMARCLSFKVENDEIHYGGYSPMISPLKVTVLNSCGFSFEGPGVSVEVLAVPLHGEGKIAGAVAQFQDVIPPRGSSETQMVIGCPRCDQVTHRFEVRLLP